MLTKLTRFVATFVATIAIVLLSLVTPNMAYADGNAVLSGKWLPATQAEMDEAKGGANYFAIYEKVEKGVKKVYYALCKKGEPVATCMKRTGVTGWKYVTQIADFISVADGIAKVRNFICSRYGKLC